MDRIDFAQGLRQQVLLGPAVGQSTPRKQQGAAVAHLSKARQRRAASIRRAHEAIPLLPAEGEALHLLVLGFFDLSALLTAVLERVGSPCLTLRCSSLSLSEKVVRDLVDLIDRGLVRSLDVLVSDYFASNCRKQTQDTANELSARGARLAKARCHAKLATLSLEDGRRYVFESSANLRGCRCFEQATITRDQGLWNFYDGWLADQTKAGQIGSTGNPAAS